MEKVIYTCQWFKKKKKMYHIQLSEMWQRSR